MTTASAGIISEFRALENLRPDWWTLWRRIPAATVFQSPAWILPWWQVFMPGELRSIVVHSRKRLVGLAPFYLENGAMGLRLLPIGIGLSDYCDVLLDPEYADEAGQAIGQALATMNEWEACEIPELLPEACALHIPAPPGSHSNMCDGSFAPVLEIALRATTLLDVIPATQGRKVSQARAITGSGRVRIAATSGDDLQPSLAALVRLHGARWSTRDEPGGVFADTRVARFHSLALPEFASENLARLYTLAIGDEIAAVYYGFHDHQRAYAYLHGFDPEHSDVRPGTLVIAHAIEEAIREGAREFHFLRGAEAYKFDWGGQPRINQTRTLVRGADPNG